MMRRYDPDTDPLVGRDSPGGGKYETLNIVGNPNMLANSRIQKSKIYSMPREKRDLALTNSLGAKGG